MIGLDKGVLSGFLSFLPVLENLIRNRKGVPLVLIHQFGIGPLITGQYTVDNRMLRICHDKAWTRGSTHKLQVILENWSAMGKSGRGHFKKNSKLFVTSL